MTRSAAILQSSLPIVVVTLSACSSGGSGIQQITPMTTSGTVAQASGNTGGGSGNTSGSGSAGSGTVSASGNASGSGSGVTLSGQSSGTAPSSGSIGPTSGSLSGSGFSGSGAVDAGTSSGSGSGTAADASVSSGATSSGSSSGGTTPPTGPFQCSVVLGLLTTGEWYNAGFPQDIGATLSPTWEGRFVHYGYVYVWADVPLPLQLMAPGVTHLGVAVWNSPIVTPCAQNSMMPDRVVFQAWSWEICTEADWIANLEPAITTIQAKYPSVKRIDLMTIIRCPNNGWCHPSMPMCGPNTDFNAQLQDCHVPQYVDDAFAKVAANHPSLVAVAPKFETPACSANIDGIHLHEQNPAVAQEIANYFKTNP